MTTRLTIFALLCFLLLGCKDDHDVTFVDDALEVEPCLFERTDRGPERLTIFVFHARGPKGKPKEQVCSDTNLNEDFSELGVVLPQGGLLFEYHPIFEPLWEARGAVGRAFATWGAPLDLVLNPEGAAGPVRDGVNVVGWRRFVGAGGGFLAAAFITDDGAEILEVDIFFNLKHKWSVGPAIEPGSTACGEQYDVQAIATHEAGHALGLGHVGEDDATMFFAAAKGELKKQTLSPGDIAGAIAVTN